MPYADKVKNVLTKRNFAVGVVVTIIVACIFAIGPVRKRLPMRVQDQLRHVVNERNYELDTAAAKRDIHQA